MHVRREAAAALSRLDVSRNTMTLNGAEGARASCQLRAVWEESGRAADGLRV